MLDVRRDLELPSVLDTDRDAVQQLSALALQVVGCEIPGLGIRHEDGRDAHVDVHFKHRELISQAFNALGDVVKIIYPFSGHEYSGASRRSTMHADELHIHHATEIPEAILKLRLHTADEHNGADVILVNSAQGIGQYETSTEVHEYVGDYDMFDYEEELTEEARRRGYDDLPRFYLEDHLGEIEGGMYNPWVHEGIVYGFKELPLYSVFFRSYAHIGSISIHSFESLDLNQPRRTRLSDMYIASQPLG